MNTVLNQQAESAYKRGDFAEALQLFTKCLEDDNGQKLAPGETGLLYHRIGNCLMRLRDFDEAIHAYTQSLADTAYQSVGAVNNNLGNCYASLRDYDNAVKCFQAAIKDPHYRTPYKPFTGLGNAYLRLGKSAEAGNAFRSGALDPNNPNPAHDLLNLGICFMALNRPSDAVQSYQSALQFHMDAPLRNRLYANLGQAYTATGQMQQAVSAFETALADKTYFLSDAANVDYRRAAGLVAQGTAVMDPITGEIPVTPENPSTQNAATAPSQQSASASQQQQQVSPQAAAAPTQQIPPTSDFSGFDKPGDSSQMYAEVDNAQANQNPYYQTAQDVQDKYQSPEDRFFHATDQELDHYGKQVAKKERKRRNVGVKIAIVVVVLVVILAGLGIFAYTQGYGMPDQETVVTQLFQTKSDSVFSSSVSQDDSASILNMISQDNNASIDQIDKAMNVSTAYVTASTAQGGQVHYQIQLSRDGLGWKISSVNLYFPSQN